MLHFSVGDISKYVVLMQKKGKLGISGNFYGLEGTTGQSFCKNLGISQKIHIYGQLSI